MADFARWATAAETAFGFKPGSFLKAYKGSREASVEVTLEADVVAHLVVQFLDASVPGPAAPGHIPGTWEGSATALYKALAAVAPPGVTYARAWPKSPNALAKHVKNRSATALAHAGVIVTATREGKAGNRILRISRVPIDTVGAVSDVRDDAESQDSSAYVETPAPEATDAMPSASCRPQSGSSAEAISADGLRFLADDTTTTSCRTDSPMSPRRSAATDGADDSDDSTARSEPTSDDDIEVVV